MNINQLSNSEMENPEKSTSIMEDNKNNDNNEEHTFSLEVKNNEEEPVKMVNIVDLNNELEDLKQKLKEERMLSITKINELNLKEIELNKEVKNLYKQTIKLIQRLKERDKNIIINTKFLSRNKNRKTEEEIKNDIKVKEAQIKLYAMKANYVKNAYEKNAKNYEQDLNKENILDDILSKFNSDIDVIESQIKNLKKIYIVHLYCPREKKSLIEKYNFLESEYKYELKREEQLSKIKIKEKDEEDAIIEEELINWMRKVKLKQKKEICFLN